jgi:curli biogenesis system outer membrane secretion channel CsgG
MPESVPMCRKESGRRRSLLPAAMRLLRRGAAATLMASVLALATAVAFAQAGAKPTTAKPATAKPATAKPAAQPAGGVDTVIALVKGGLSEARVIKSLQDEGRAYKLSPADLLKLSNAGVSEAIISAMENPRGGAAPAAEAAPAAVRVAAPAGGITPFPPDLADVPSSTKRRLAVQPFDYSTVMNWVTYWFNNPTNIGEGIRAMLTVRMAQSNTITLLERANIDTIMKEQDFAASNRVRRGSGARIGQLSGADAMLMGDIVIFGRDDTTKRKGFGAIIGRVSPIAGAVATMEKSEKAVVGINLRIVDAETGEVIETAEARGESSRSSKDYAGLLGGKGAAVGGASGMTSSNFQQTIIGEATSNAVSEVVKYLEGKVPSLPAKPRDIEGRVAVIGAGGTITLAVGSENGVLRGDRFEILQINGEIKDPVTKEVIDIDAVKIGEFVADGIREKTSAGAYGGQPLSNAVLSAAGKGYAARLVRK